MAADNIYKIVQEIFESSELPERRTDVSRAFVPFSLVSTNKESKYIYIGSEKMPFKERDPNYQKIFIYEFLHVEEEFTL